MRTIILLAFLGLATAAAHAQEFGGRCNVLKDEAGCKGTGWCNWVAPKAVTLPDGTQFSPAARCQFKAHHAAAWKAAHPDQASGRKR